MVTCRHHHHHHHHHHSSRRRRCLPHLLGVRRNVLALAVVVFLCPLVSGVHNVIDAVKLRKVGRAATLLARGGDLTATDSLGWTALHNAANIGQEAMVRLLIDYGASLDTREPNHGKTAVHIAAHSGQVAALQALLEAGANLEAKDINGQTALHLATWQGQLKAIALLLDHGANVDAQDKWGSTPVFLATLRDLVKAVRELLQFCPDLRLPDAKDRTVTQYARDTNLTAILSALKDHARQTCNKPKHQNQAKKLHIVKEGTTCPRGEKRYPGDESSSWWLRETSAGETVLIPCPAGVNGSATWTCLPDGTWDRTPILSQCQAVIFAGWREALEAGDNVTAAQILSSMATSLQNISLAPGDLLTLARILHSLQQKHLHDLQQRSASMAEALSLAQVYMEGMMVAANTMLSGPTIAPLWWGLPPEQRANTSTHLQTALTSAAVSLAHLQKAPTRDFTQEKLHVKVIQQPPAYFRRESGRRSYTHSHYNLTTLTLPHSFHRGYAEGRTTVKVVFVSFATLHCTSNTIPCDPRRVVAERDLPAKGQVNSAIIGAAVGNETWHAALGEAVEVRLQHIYSGDTFELGAPTCVWWDVDSSSWATHGCRLANTSANYSVCHCDHLAYLAVIMDVNSILDTTDVLYYVMKFVTVVGCVVSVVSLTLCVICFFGFREVRGRASSAVHANLCLCLLGSELLVLGGLDALHRPVVCTVVAALLHFLFLATFTWSAIEAFHIYLSFVKVWRTGMGLVKYYMCVGYLVPLVYVAITLALTHTIGYGSPGTCWLAPRGLIWTFAAPVAAILLVNISAFVMTVRAAWWKKSPEDSRRGKKWSENFSHRKKGAGDTNRLESGAEDTNQLEKKAGDTNRLEMGGGIRKGGKNWRGLDEEFNGTIDHERRSVDATEHERRSVDATEQERRSVVTTEQERRSVDATEHKRRSVDATEHESQTVDTTEHERQSVDTIKHERRSVDTIKHETRSVDTIKHETRSVDTIKHERRSMDTINNGKESVDTEKRSWDSKRGSGSGASKRCQQQQQPSEDTGERAGLGRRFCSSITVLLLLCLTWLTGFLYFTEGTLAVAVMFTLLNSVQGVAIFLLHVVLNEHIMHEVRGVLK
nr:adhesion G protein-coupled receptor L3-like [Procambarus clarkii]